MSKRKKEGLPFARRWRSEVSLGNIEVRAVEVKGIEKTQIYCHHEARMLLDFRITEAEMRRLVSAWNEYEAERVSRFRLMHKEEDEE
jgi:hypothetical protein